MLVLEVASDDDDLVSEHEESKTLLAESFPRVWVPCSRGSSLPYILPHDIHEYASGRILNNECHRINVCDQQNETNTLS